MVAEVLDCLEPRDRRLVLDCTLGPGGHAEALLESPGFEGRVVGLDRDREALERASQRLKRFGERFVARQGRFSRLAGVLEELKCGRPDAVLLDLGASSLQLDGAGRGFSFRLDGPLDMRMDPSCGPTAADLVAELDEESLAQVIRDYGEERRCRRIAAAIVREREKEPIVTTGRLAELVRRALGGGRGRINPATRTFQALRIAVNDELGELEKGLQAATGCLAPDGRLTVISFHSLEDRIVKRFLRDLTLRGGCELLTRKPLRPSEDEVASNPRSRSAKLRAARMTSPPGDQQCA